MKEKIIEMLKSVDFNLLDIDLCDIFECPKENNGNCHECPAYSQQWWNDAIKELEAANDVF